MTSLNFDSVHFRRVISRSRETESVPSLRQLLLEATQRFYDEFDYYPDTGACAPGTFTIMGDYMELAEGYVVQAALPMLTLILAKCHYAAKCRVVTCSQEVDDPKRILFPVLRCRPLKKGYPEWADLLKGVANLFLHKNKKGFDALIHSSVPISRGFGSSSALEAAYYTLFARLADDTCEEDNMVKAKKCKCVDETYGGATSGLFNNFTVFFADVRQGVIVDTGLESEVVTFSFRDPNVLFLLTLPQADLLRHRKDLLRTRGTELKLAAKFLDLEHIKYAKECHLEVLATMEDPTREKVVAILRQFESDEDYICDFVEELFTLPRIDSEVLGEDYVFDRGEGAEGDDQPFLPATGEDQRSFSYVEFGGEAGSYFDFTYRTVCDETLCLGGLSDLSARSDLTVMSKLRRRVRHVITENMRIKSFARHVTDLDFVSAGIDITRSHLSLKVDFEVSCPKLDKLVQFTAQCEKGVYGSKMMRNGGTITLLHRNFAEDLIDRIKDRFGGDFEFHLVFPGPGTTDVQVGVPPAPKSFLSNVYLNPDELMKKAVVNFDATYKRMPTHGYFAPATFSVLGVHSSFNQSYSLPMAVSMGTVVVGALNGSGKIRAATTAEPPEELQKVIFQIPSLEPLKPGRTRWANYVKGIVSNFKGTVPGFDCLIESSTPMGGRIFHGASLQVAVYGFLEELTHLKTFDESEKSCLCMRAEQAFTDTVCGMDEFLVALLAAEDRMIAVDCKKCTHMYLPFFDPSLVFVIVYADVGMVPYKAVLYKRLEQCYDVARALGLNSLRCATEEDLEGLTKVSEVAIKRARHVISEERRVVEGMRALNKFDIDKFGRLMVDSHISLRDEFEVSNPVLDNLVERSMEVDGVVGAKMTGSEYGASVTCLVKRWAADDLIDYIRDTCDGEFDFYIATPSDGARRLDIKGHVASLPGPHHTFERILGSSSSSIGFAEERSACPATTGGLAIADDSDELIDMNETTLIAI